jgi:hypothetical protein
MNLQRRDPQQGPIGGDVEKLQPELYYYPNSVPSSKQRASSYEAVRSLTREALK